eukprot:7980577-Pyramimonas_sp.AAC.1
MTKIWRYKTSSAKRRLAKRVSAVKTICMPDCLLRQVSFMRRKIISSSALKSRELKWSPCITPRWTLNCLLVLSTRAVA